MKQNFYDTKYYSKADKREAYTPKRQRSMRATKERELEFYKKNSYLSPGTRLLDVGCGSGLYLEAIDGSGVDLWGIDISEIATASAKERVSKPDQIICADAVPMPFQDEFFDVVTAWGVVEHFPCTDTILKEIYRTLKHNGRAIIMVPNIYYYKYVFDTWRKGTGPVKHQEIEFLYAFKEWQALIESNGFKVAKTDRHNKFSKKHLLGLRNLIPFYLSNHFVYHCQKV